MGESQMKSEHVVKSFDEDLLRLKNAILEMGELAQWQLEKSLIVLDKNDKVLAGRVADYDDKVDRKLEEVNNLCIKMLALRQPMASDLRTIISALRMSVDLERVADYTVNIVRSAMEIEDQWPQDEIQKSLRMGQIALDMLRGALSAYRELSAEKSIEIWRTDRKLDDIYSAFLFDVRERMKADPESIPAGSRLLFMARSFERIGDHITNIMEQVYFMVKGGSLIEAIALNTSI